MQLTLGPRSYDLTTRALVMGVLAAPGDPVDPDADIVEVADPGRAMPIPICVVASGDAEVHRALDAGVSLLRLPSPTTRALEMCAGGGVAVVVPAEATDRAHAAGLPSDRIVPDDLVLDVTVEDCPMAATAVGVIRGARIVRTADVRGARRTCDVLAAVLQAR